MAHGVVFGEMAGQREEEWGDLLVQGMGQLMAPARERAGGTLEESLRFSSPVLDRPERDDGLGWLQGESLKALRVVSKGHRELVQGAWQLERRAVVLGARWRGRRVTGGAASAVDRAWSEILMGVGLGDVMQPPAG